MSTAELFRAEMRSIFTTRVLSPGDLAPFVGHNSARIYLLSYAKCMHAKHHDENVKWKVERVQIVISFFFKFKLWKKSSQIWLLIVPLTLNCTCTLNAFSALTYHFKQSYNQKYSLRYRPDYRGQPKAGTGYKMLLVPFVFSMSRFQGPSFRCNRIVVIVTLLEAIEGIPDSTDSTKIIIFEGTKTSTIFTRDYFMSENLRVDI